MKYLKLFEYYNQENFKQVLLDNMSKITLKEAEHDISQYTSFDELLNDMNSDSFELTSSLIMQIAQTYKQMFKNYLFRYTGEIKFKSLKDYIIKFPLIVDENHTFNSESEKLKDVIETFKSKYPVFSAILGENNKYIKGEKRQKESIIGDDFCIDLAFQNFVPDAVYICSKLIAPYFVELIGEDMNKYLKLVNLEPESVEMINIHYTLVREVNKLLPDWMRRSDKGNLWEF